VPRQELSDDDFDGIGEEDDGIDEKDAGVSGADFSLGNPSAREEKKWGVAELVHYEYQLQALEEEAEQELPAQAKLASEPCSASAPLPKLSLQQVQEPAADSVPGELFTDIVKGWFEFSDVVQWISHHENFITEMMGREGFISQASLVRAD
jgi:hypothetical protein